MKLSAEELQIAKRVWDENYINRIGRDVYNRRTRDNMRKLRAAMTPEQKRAYLDHRNELDQARKAGRPRPPRPTIASRITAEEREDLGKLGFEVVD
jgi:hypothetical protein